MVQFSFPLIFTRNSVPDVPRKSVLRGVCAFGSCERLLFAESLLTCSAHPPPLSCNKWRNNGTIMFCHLFLHAIAFLACPGNPFFAAIARSVRANDCCLQNAWL